MQEKNKLFETMIGATLEGFARSCDLVCFTFVNGDKEVHIHCQCFLRAVYKGEIITNSNDMFFPADFLGKEEKNNFEWDRFGSTEFDVRMQKMIDDISSRKVVSFEQSGLDFKIRFENDCFINIISLYSGGRENWRMFIKGNKHIVFYNNFVIE